MASAESPILWLKQCWQVAAFAEEINTGLLARRIAGEAVVLYRIRNKEPIALADACAHRHVPLSYGTLVGDEVQCRYHGMRYNSNGICTSVPGQERVPENARVRAFPVLERDGLVWIWMGDPDRADVGAIPLVPELNDSKWDVVRGYHHIECAPLLIVDNLLDLSHETFVHEDTIGSSAVAESPVTAEIKDNKRVRVHRYMSNIEPPPLFVEQRGSAERIDRWHTSVYTPPGIIVIESGSKPGNGSVQVPAQERRIINFVTPETDTTSHYFWCIARNHHLNNPEFSSTLRARISFTFDQDKALLEVQQRSIGTRTDPMSNVTIKVDAGPIQGRRLLRTLVDHEVEAAAAVDFPRLSTSIRAERTRPASVTSTPSTAPTS